VNADPDVQLRLLDLQAQDAALDRLGHRRRTLPELEEIERLEQRLAALADEVVRAETEDRDLGREQGKLENDVEQVRSRMARDQQRLDTGAVSSPKELENLQSEIESLHRRQADLEDGVLEVMEQREAVQERLSALRRQHAETSAAHEAASARRDASYAEIDEESGRASKERAAIAAELPSDLVGLYESIRGSHGGVGAAALHRGRCEGCHLQLNKTDLVVLRDAPPDAVLRCEECRRILVRTPESGL
jgi:predicted  nucleic acid-binding Zn-ribbon protein